MIENQGSFYFSSGTINGFVLDEDGNYTDERTTAYFGPFLNDENGTFVMDGGLITGFHATGSYNSSGGVYYPGGGGGVYNCGTFTMNGGAIQNNSTGTSTDGSADSGNAGGYGGGVNNLGVFYMNGGTISGNTATYGGGVYCDTARNFSRNDSGFDVAASEFYMTGGEIVDNSLNSNIISSGTQSVMHDVSTYRVSNLGSSLYVSGGSTVVISGGKIDGEDIAYVDTNPEEVEEDDFGSVEGSTSDSSDKDVNLEAVRAGIAVVPASTTTAGATGSSFTSTRGADATLTITGSPEINDGIVLLSAGQMDQYATVTNEGKEGYVSSDSNTYEYVIDRETSSLTGSSWLTLDGALETALTVTTLDSFTDTIHFFYNSTSAGMDRVTSVSQTIFTLDRDGDIIAAYKDRVTPDENDAALLNVNADLYQSHMTFTLTSEQDSNNRGSTETEIIERDYDFEGWAICSHSEELTYVEAVDATCTEDGNLEYYLCEVCGKTFADADATDEIADVIIPATGHSETRTHIYANPATCTEDGNMDYYACSVCGQPFTANIGGSELTLEDVTIPATGHTLASVEGTAATCTEDGLTAGIVCSACGEILVAQETIPAFGHNLIKVEAAAADCTTSGNIEYYVCDICGELFADENGTPLTEDTLIPAEGHTLVLTDATAATCTEGGLTAGVMCSVCGTWLIEPEETQPIAHTMVKHDAVEATETESGNIEYYECAVCGKLFLDAEGTQETTLEDVITAPTGHVGPCAIDVFEDITDEDAWYYDAVDYVYHAGIMTGTSDTTFGPDDTFSRAQMVTVLYRLADSPDMSGVENPFTDVSESDWFYNEVMWAYSTGVTTGTSETTFSPNDPVTREQVILFLYRFTNEIKERDTASESFSDLDGYTDVSDVSSWALEAVRWSVGNGIVQGTSDTTLDSGSTADRKTAAQMMYNYLVGYLGE